MAAINYFDSVQIQLSTLMAKAFIYIYVLRAMSHTSYAAQVWGFIFQPAKFNQTITHQHLLTLRESHIDGTILFCVHVLIAHHIFIIFLNGDYFQWIWMLKRRLKCKKLFCDYITWLKYVHHTCAYKIFPFK